jgi:ammonia channel protein AmtB
MNTMMALACGFAGSYFSSKGDPFFTASGGLAGIIAVSAGMDLYHPALVGVLAFVVAAIMPKVAILIEKMGIDDAVGAFAVHGFCGIMGALLPGIFAIGYIQQPGVPPISFVGQLVPVLIQGIVLGFLPGFGFSWILKKLHMLRVSEEIELEGLDIKELGIEAYPESHLANKS